MSLYFWLGIAAEDHLPPEADEDAQYTIEDYPDGGFTARLEGDGFITVHPQVPTPPTH